MMEWFAKLFEDKKFLTYAIKVCAIFGPGFLAIGYFERQAFIELDWLKLVSLSGIFSVAFTLPLFVLLFVFVNLDPWMLGTRLGHKARKLTNARREAVSLAGDTDGLTKDEIKRLQVVEKKIDKTYSEIIDLKKEVDSLHTDLYSVVTIAWIYFIILFVVVAYCVAVDYIFVLNITFRELVYLLGWFFYVGTSLMTCGLWMLLSPKRFVARRWMRVILQVMGATLAVVGLFVAWKHAQFN
jgi:hypothetical protein